MISQFKKYDFSIKKVTLQFFVPIIGAGSQSWNLMKTAAGAETNSLSSATLVRVITMQKGNLRQNPSENVDV